MAGLVAEVAVWFGRVRCAGEGPWPVRRDGWMTATAIMLREGGKGKNEQRGQCDLNGFHNFLRMPAGSYGVHWRDISNNIKYNPDVVRKLRLDEYSSIAKTSVHTA
jgi:hypothetical protein